MYTQPASSRSGPPAPVGMTEFDILKAKHKFLRDEDEATAASDKTSGKANDNASWEDRLAQKYYASLYREFAVCDLKHYKSGNFALRWRTEDEVISGAGEETCGNTRCALHAATSDLGGSSSSTRTRSLRLKTVEVPFAYEEHGEYKSALVKVVLCEKCLKKLMWKHEREKEERKMEREEEVEEVEVKVEEEIGVVKVKTEEEGDERMKMKLSMDDEHKRRRERSKEGGTSRRHRNSRSLSPHSHRRQRELKDKRRRHEHSPLE